MSASPRCDTWTSLGGACARWPSLVEYFVMIRDKISVTKHVGIMTIFAATRIFLYFVESSPRLWHLSRLSKVVMNLTVKFDCFNSSFAEFGGMQSNG